MLEALSTLSSIPPSTLPVCLVSTAKSAVADLVTFHQRRHHLVPTSSYHEQTTGIALESGVKEIVGAKEQGDYEHKKEILGYNAF